MISMNECQPENEVVTIEMLAISDKDYLNTALSFNCVMLLSVCTNDGVSVVCDIDDDRHSMLFIP
jgi:hypothetical protein